MLECYAGTQICATSDGQTHLVHKSRRTKLVFLHGSPNKRQDKTLALVEHALADEDLKEEQMKYR